MSSDDIEPFDWSRGFFGLEDSLVEEDSLTICSEDLMK